MSTPALQLGASNLLLNTNIVQPSGFIYSVSGKPAIYTQLGSITTTVSTTGSCFQILTQTATVSAGSSTTFLVVNNLVASSSYIICTRLSNGSGPVTGVPYILSVNPVSAGQFNIVIENWSTTAALNQQFLIQCVIIG